MYQIMAPHECAENSATPGFDVSVLQEPQRLLNLGGQDLCSGVAEPSSRSIQSTSLFEVTSYRATDPKTTTVVSDARRFSNRSESLFRITSVSKCAFLSDGHSVPK